jgi:hypothetical protein
MVKCKGRQRTRHEGPEGEQYSNYSFFNLAARWGGWLTPRTALFTPEKETRYQLCRRSGPWGRSVQVREIRPHRVSNIHIHALHTHKIIFLK